MKNTENKNHIIKRTLNSDERKKLRNSIGQAVLEPVFSSKVHEQDSHSYLRLIHSADIAYKESADLLEDAVHQARRINHSWSAIGDVLGVSRQAAQQRFNPNPDRTPDTSVSDNKNKMHRITGAHAFNEMGILEIQGRAGNHLVGFGPLFLYVEESEQQWEHKRVTSFSWQTSKTLEKDGWIYVGAWLPFHYYKRPIVE
ncbi:MAG: hypothetical protein GY781_18640 [Gammaproteobacteria bacterium]|nr:hypothetical protein [Gammaproteobacteria bacterium]